LRLIAKRILFIHQRFVHLPEFSLLEGGQGSARCGSSLVMPIEWKLLKYSSNLPVEVLEQFFECAVELPTVRALEVGEFDDRDGCCIRAQCRRFSDRDPRALALRR
jgi:hypothetical protein